MTDNKNFDRTRIRKGLSERIYLLNNEGYTYTIKGQSDKLYNVKFLENDIRCSCPDNKIRALYCKHIYFMLFKVFGYSLEYIIDYKDSMIELCKETDKSKDFVRKENKENCIICFDELGYSYEKCKTCIAEYHIACIDIWNKYNNNCPMCRTKF